jgi:glutamate racemase
MSELSNRPIGVFDSGSGGLSILESIRELLPGESYLYLGDHANIPYGNKSTDVIRERTARAIRFFISRHAKLVVIACNTSTIAGIDWYRSQFPDVPIVGVVPVIKTAAKISKTKHIIVLSTEYTAKSEYQKNLITQFADGCDVTSLGSAQLVPLIEQGKLGSAEIRNELAQLLTHYTSGVHDVLVLGCTHYPFLKPLLHAMIDTDTQILDSGGAVARQVQRILRDRSELSQSGGSTVEYYTTASDVQPIQSVFSTLLKHDVTAEHITL